MNIFDIIVFAILFSSTLMGLYKGLIRFSIGFLSFILSLVSAYYIFPLVESAVAEHLKNAIAVNVTSALAGYLLCMIFFALLAAQVTKAVDGVSGGLIDRLFGMGAGIIRGLIICSIIFGIIAIFTSDAYIESSTAKDIAKKIDHNKYPKWLTESKSFSVIESSSQIIGRMISDKTLEKLKLPKNINSLPESQEELINKAADVAAQNMIDKALILQSISAPISDSKDVHAPNPLNDNDEGLESQLEDLLAN